MKTMDVPLGARIPKDLKKKLNSFCQDHGLKMSFVVASALEDKLGELEDELEDKIVARERLQDAEFASQDNYDQYLKHRLGKR